MNDELKDLLTLAAKACEPHIKQGPDGVLRDCSACSDPNMNIFAFPVWAPHLDDGDGARMETDVDIDIVRYEDRVVSSTSITRRIAEYYADHNNDRQAARRWASLRAAAQIGKGMKQ